jgi:hypothetical protein
MNFQAILAAIGNLFSQQPQELISPVPKEMLGNRPSATPTPTPMPTPDTRQYRNPQWDQWSKQNPKGFNELLSATKAAAQQYNVPQALLMDISGLETSGGQQLTQTSGGPGRGFYQFEPSTFDKIAGSNFDPNSATQSALLAAKEIANKRLSRWGTPGSNWGTLDNPNRAQKITDWYKPEELNKFLVSQYQFPLTAVN